MINFGHSFFLSDLLAVLYLALVVSVASLTYRYVEEPARLFFNGLARKHMAGGKSAVVKA